MKRNWYTASIVVFFCMFSLQSTAQADPIEFLVDTDDGVLTTESLIGQVVYIDFWASWCVPCRKSFPWMNDMQAKYQDRDFKIIAVNLDKDKSLAQEFLNELPADFAIGYDPAGQLAEKFRVIGMPMAFLINRKGELIHKHTGFKSSKIAGYEQSIMDALENTE